MTVKTLIVLLVLVLGYIATTLTLFGAVDPCDILVVRQEDHEIAAAEKQHMEDIESLKKMASKTLPKENYARFVQNLDEYSNASLRAANQKQSVITALRQKTRDMTTAQCAWQAITWQPGA